MVLNRKWQKIMKIKSLHEPLVSVLGYLAHLWMLLGRLHVQAEHTNTRFFKNTTELQVDTFPPGEC